MKITMNILKTKEMFDSFFVDYLIEEYGEELTSVNKEDIFEMQKFLDNHAIDIKRLSRDECELFNLDYEQGFYISTWNGEYLEKCE